MIPTPIDGTHDDGQTHHRVHWSERPPRVWTHETSTLMQKNTHAPGAHSRVMTLHVPPPSPAADTIPHHPSRVGSRARAGLDENDGS